MMQAQSNKEAEEKRQRIVRRMYIYKACFDLLKKRWDNTGKIGFTLSDGLLQNVATSYFDDLDRMKAYHGIQFADECKQSAFSIKWLVRIRPIQINVSDEDFSLGHGLANEYLALRVGFAMLGIDSKAISPTFFRDLVYTLHYRPLDDGMLIMLMYAIKKASSCGTV